MYYVRWQKNYSFKLLYTNALKVCPFKSENQTLQRFKLESWDDRRMLVSWVMFEICKCTNPNSFFLMSISPNTMFLGGTKVVVKKPQTTRVVTRKVVVHKNKGYKGKHKGYKGYKYKNKGYKGFKKVGKAFGKFFD